MSKLLMVTGTDTEVGKTYFTALLARALKETGVNVGVYKPVASGCIVEDDELVSEDAVALASAIDQMENLNRVCPQRFRAMSVPGLTTTSCSR